MTRHKDKRINNDEDPLEESNNRLFLIVAGILGGFVLLGLLCIAGYLFFRNSTNQQSEATGQFLATQQAATIQAGLTQTNIAQDLTQTAGVTNTVPPTNTPVIAQATATISATANPATATVGAAFTQIAVSTQTIIPTSTALPLTAVPPTTVLPETPTPAPTSIGRIEITYPLEMVVDEDDIVTVEIRVNPEIAGLGIIPGFGTGIISIETNSQDPERAQLEDQIRLYPVMLAELIAPNFDISAGNNSNRRTVSMDHSAAWTWNMVARKAGTQKITINIFGETTFDGEKITILEMSKSRNVSVIEKPMLTRIFNGLANNWVAIVGTSGPIGLLLAYFTYRASQENKALKSQMADMEKKLNDLKKAPRKKS